MLFGKKEKPKSLVAILIDMQEVFLRELSVEERNKIIAGQVRIIEECADRDIPLVIVEYSFKGPTLLQLKRKIAWVRRQKTVVKFTNNPFDNAQFQQALQDFGANSLLKMGVHASYCVLSGAMSAHRRNFKILTGDDLIANCDCARCRPLKKSREWYKANGVYYDEPASMDKILEDAKAAT